MNNYLKEEWNFQIINSPHFNEESYFLDHNNKFSEFKEIIDSLGEISNVCDIGVSTGIFYKNLEKNNIKISGVDIVPEYVEVAKKRGIDARVCDISKESLPFADSSFDLVVCDSILEHTFKPNFLISEGMRVLKEGGYFLLAVPNALSFKMRWDYLRGRNQFWPLIGNLISETGYLKRCSVFYGHEEIKKLFPKRHVEPFYIHEDFYRGRKSSFMSVVINLLSKIFPSGRTMLAVLIKK